MWDRGEFRVCGGILEELGKNNELKKRI